MVRRLALASLLAGATAVVAVAQVPVTLVTTDGDRISGHLTYRVENRVGNVGIAGPNERWFPVDQIAIISFVQGDPSAAEIRQLPESEGAPTERHRFVQRDGTLVAATLDYINPNGQEITYDGPMGRRVVPSSSLSRIYLNPRAARSLYASLLKEQGQTAGASERTVTVNQQWVDTGITVNRGDRVAFRASGELRVRRPNQTDLVITPKGAEGEVPQPADRRRLGSSSSMPVPGSPMGALIGRVGRGAPFVVGEQTEPITMGDSGRLMLGINTPGGGNFDGGFRVEIARR